MANDVLFGISVYVFSCIATALGQESEYLKTGLSDMEDVILNKCSHVGPKCWLLQIGSTIKSGPAYKPASACRR